MNIERKTIFRNQSRRAIRKLIFTINRRVLKYLATLLLGQGLILWTISSSHKTFSKESILSRLQLIDLATIVFRLMWFAGMVAYCALRAYWACAPERVESFCSFYIQTWWADSPMFPERTPPSLVPTPLIRVFYIRKQLWTCSHFAAKGKWLTLTSRVAVENSSHPGHKRNYLNFTRETLLQQSRVSSLIFNNFAPSLDLNLPYLILSMNINLSFTAQAYASWAASEYWSDLEHKPYK